MYVLSQVPLYGSFRNAFRGVRTVIVDKIDVSHGLIDVLLREGVLHESHVSDIRVSTLSSRPLQCLFSAKSIQCCLVKRTNMYLT